MSAPPLPGDMKAGFIGLGIAVAFLLVVVTSIVFISNRVTAHHEEPAAAARER